MRLHPCIFSSAAVIALTCVVSAAAYYYRHRNKEINEVMVFCRLQFNAFNCFDRLISYIESAKHSINICMPGIHNQAIQGRLIEIMDTKRIGVRIIIDRFESSDSLLKDLHDAGAQIRYKSNERVHRMQHKFCVVDDEILLTGTLDWGNDRSSEHWNYVYITSKKQLVDPVTRNFSNMWNGFATDVEFSNDYSSNSDSGSVEITNDVDDVDVDVGGITLRETQDTPELHLA